MTPPDIAPRIPARLRHLRDTVEAFAQAQAAGLTQDEARAWVDRLARAIIRFRCEETTAAKRAKRARRT